MLARCTESLWLLPAGVCLCVFVRPSIPLLSPFALQLSEDISQRPSVGQRGQMNRGQEA